MTSMDEQNDGHHLFVVNRIEDERRIIPSRITGEKAPPTCWVFKKNGLQELLTLEMSQNALKEKS